MTDTDKARELLAAEYEKDNPHSEVAKKLRLQFSGQLRRADVIALRAINAALRTAPEGFAMVPVEPTDGMLDAGIIAGDGKDWSGPQAVWVAMLAAAQEGSDAK